MIQINNIYSNYIMKFKEAYEMQKGVDEKKLIERLRKEKDRFKRMAMNNYYRQPQRRYRYRYPKVNKTKLTDDEIFNFD